MIINFEHFEEKRYKYESEQIIKKTAERERLEREYEFERLKSENKYQSGKNTIISFEYFRHVAITKYKLEHENQYQPPDTS